MWGKPEVWNIPGKDICKGNIRACLGNQVSAEQIAQIRPILKKLGDKTGILHLESYSENNTTITFEMEDISQEN